MIDTHTHLNLPPLSDAVRAVLRNAQVAGVSEMLVVGTNLSTSTQAIALAKEHSQVHASVGIHPEEAGQAAQEFAMLEELLVIERRHVSAIGECGLDYSGDVDHEAQAVLFRRHIDLALAYNLPLVIHCRNSRRLGDAVPWDAYGDLLKILREQSKLPRFVLHCVSGSADYVRSAIELGAYVSFAGNVTYPSAQAIRELLPLVPQDRLLVETDAPFLPPQSHRGETNEPAYIADTGRFLADFLSIDQRTFDQFTTANSRKFFGF